MNGKVSVVKKGGSLTWRFWRVIFSDGIIDGFKKTACTATAIYIVDGITNGFEMVDPYGDVLIVPSESSTISPMECPSVKVNICPIYWPSPLLFLLLLPNPNSPHLQTTSPPPPKQKSPSYQHNKLYFLKFCGHSIRVLIYRWILSIFVSNSIFLNFNI